MKIACSNLHLSSHHETVERHQRREHLTVWRDGEAPAETQGRQTESGLRARLAELKTEFKELHISQKAHSLQPYKVKAVAPEDGEVTSIHDLKILTLKLMVEHITVREIKLMKPEDLHHEAEEITIEQPSQAEAAAAPEREGWGLVYDYYESHYEGEFTSFSAEGVVHTQDGKTISIQIDLNMSREFLTKESFSLRAGAALKDPLVLNFNGTAAELTETKFSFDLDTDGREDQISFVGPNSGFLALDKNDDGIINNGSELFGPTSGNGFDELSAYDLDENNWIDENDDIYSRLRIWSKDAEGNDSLMALGQRNVGAIFLGHIDTPFLLADQNNEQQGQIRSSGLFLEEDGGAGAIQQLDLVV